MTQQELFLTTKSEVKKTFTISSANAQNEYLQHLRTDSSIWDMRTWNKYHDIEEVKAWVANPIDCKNAGHGHYCIIKLKEDGVTEETIIAAIMANFRISYSHRVCACMLVDPKEFCTRYKAAGNYADAKCELCHNDQGVKHDFTRKNTGVYQGKRPDSVINNIGKNVTNTSGQIPK